MHNNNNNNNTRIMFMVLSSWLCNRVIARVHPVHAMNAEQPIFVPSRQTWAVGPPVSSTWLNPPSPFIITQSESILPSFYHHFTIPQMVEGWRHKVILRSSWVHAANGMIWKILCDNSRTEERLLGAPLKCRDAPPYANDLVTRL